jgi:hypothetical protein
MPMRMWAPVAQAVCLLVLLLLAAPESGAQWYMRNACDRIQEKQLRACVSGEPYWSIPLRQDTDSWGALGGFRSADAAKRYKTESQAFCRSWVKWIGKNDPCEHDEWGEPICVACGAMGSRDSQGYLDEATQTSEAADAALRRFAAMARRAMATLRHGNRSQAVVAGDVTREYETALELSFKSSRRLKSFFAASGPVGHGLAQELALFTQKLDAATAHAEGLSSQIPQKSVARSDSTDFTNRADQAALARERAQGINAKVSSGNFSYEEDGFRVSVWSSITISGGMLVVREDCTTVTLRTTGSAAVLPPPCPSGESSVAVLDLDLTNPRIVKVATNGAETVKVIIARRNASDTTARSRREGLEFHAQSASDARATVERLIALTVSIRR